jgi:hypothetical protein
MATLRIRLCLAGQKDDINLTSHGLTVMRCQRIVLALVGSVTLDQST